MVGVQVGDLSQDGRRLSGVKQPGVALLRLGDRREDRALLRVDSLDLLLLRGGPKPPEVVVLVGDLALLERDALSPPVQLGRERDVRVRGGEDARGRAHALSHQQGVFSLVDHRLIRRAHGAGRDGLAGHQVRRPHLETDGDTLTVKSDQDRGGGSRARTVTQSPCGHHGEHLGIHTGGDRALDLEHAVLPQGEAPERTHVSAGLSALKNEARQTRLQGHAQEPGRGRMQPGRDVRALEVEGLLDRARRDEDERRLLLLEHREVLVTITIGVQANDTRSPGQVTQERSGVVDELRRDRGGHVREREPGHGARLGDGLSELRDIGDLSHGALMKRQAGLVGAADPLALGEGVIRRGGREPLSDARAQAGDHRGDVPEALREDDREARVLTQRQELPFRVRLRRLRRQSTLDLGVESLSGHLRALELAKLSNGARSDLAKRTEPEAQPRAEGDRVQRIEAGEQRLNVPVDRHVRGEPKLGVEHHARGSRGDHTRGRVGPDSTTDEHRERASERENQAEQNERRSVRHQTTTFKTTGDDSLGAGGDRGLNLGGLRDLHPRRPAERRLGADQRLGVRTPPGLSGHDDRLSPGLFARQDSIDAIPKDDRRCGLGRTGRAFKGVATGDVSRDDGVLCGHGEASCIRDGSIVP